MTYTFTDLQQSLPQTGIVQGIYLRPAKFADPLSVKIVQASQNYGLEGDHYHSITSRKRQVTLIQYEHIGVLASLLNRTALEPELLRRNIVVSGINLLALKDQKFSVGSAVLEMTGLCHPCSRMEKALGPGGYNVMRGHGGITARVVTDGEIKLGDIVAVIR